MLSEPYVQEILDCHFVYSQLQSQMNSRPVLTVMTQELRCSASSSDMHRHPGDLLFCTLLYFLNWLHEGRITLLTGLSLPYIW